tara:strand:+ start:136 stop:585 length:450 start_codon:yes stop_codon:yes gene_type:complete
MVVCVICERELQPDWKSCPYCSIPVVIEKQETESESTNEIQATNTSSNPLVMQITVVVFLVLFLPIYGLFGNQTMVGIALTECKEPSLTNDDSPFAGSGLDAIEQELYESCKKYRSKYAVATIMIILFNGLVISIIKNDTQKQSEEKQP